MNFDVVNNFDSDQGRLRKVTYQDHTGETMAVKYIYSGDLGVDNPYIDKCESMQGGVCNENALLVEVEIRDITGTEYTRTIEPGDYNQRGMCGADDCGGDGLGCGLKCHDTAANNYCLALTKERGFDYGEPLGYVTGSKTCFADYANWGNWANHPTDPLNYYCGTSGSGWIESMDCRFRMGSGLLFPTTKYEYYMDPITTEHASFFALEKINSPLGATTTYEYTTTDYLLCGNVENLMHKKMIDNYVIKEDTGSPELLYQYSYEYPPPSDCYENEFPRSITTILGPTDNNGKYTKTEFEYFTMELGGNEYYSIHDFISGKEYISRLYECDSTTGCGTGESNLKRETKTSYSAFHPQWGTQTWLGALTDLENDWFYCSAPINLCGGAWDTFYIRDDCSGLPLTDCISGCRWTGFVCAPYEIAAQPTTISFPTGSVTRVIENGEEKRYAQGSYFDKYINPKVSSNYGEVDSATWETNHFPTITALPDSIPDNIRTKTRYVYENNPEYEGAGDLYKYFPRLANETNITDPDTGNQLLRRVVYDAYNNQGSLLSSSVWDNTPGNNRWLTTQLFYDAFGNVNHVINPDNKRYYMEYLTSIPGVALTREWAYAEEGNEDSKLEKSYTYYPHNYALLSQTDENDNVYTYKYDHLGRLTKVITPVDSETYPATEIEYHDFDDDKHTVVYSKKDGTTRFNPVYHYYDNLGRRTETKQFDSLEADDIVVETLYNIEGLVDSVSKPFYDDTGGTSLKTSYKYDALNRVEEVTPAGTTNTVDTVFGTNWNQITDENENYVKVTKDAYGRTIIIEDTTGETTHFQYDKLGNLKQTTDAMTRVSTAQYNSLGQTRLSVHPDAGQVEYTYDLSGNVDTMYDEITRLQYIYDDINRPVQVKDLATDEVLKEFEYDVPCSNGRGRLCSVEEGDVRTIYSYDAKGNIVFVIHSIFDIDYRVDYEYYTGGKIKRITYPQDGATWNYVNYIYNNIGQLSGVEFNGNSVQQIQYNPTGTVSGIAHGNGLSTSYSYTNRDWIQSITAPAFTRYMWYDKVGNILEVHNAPTRTNLYAEYVYDNLYRLTNVYDHGRYDESFYYEYDEVGNRERHFTGLGTPNIQEFNYAYGRNNNQITATEKYDYAYSDTGNLEEKYGKSSFNIGFGDTNRVADNNLLWNGGFECGDFGDVWTVHSDVGHEITDETSHSGDYAIKVNVNEWSYSKQEVTIIKDAQYKLSGWMKTENWNSEDDVSGATLVVECHQTDCSSGEHWGCAEHNLDCPSSSSECNNIGIISDEWTYMEYEFTGTAVAPATTRCIKIMLYGGPCGSGICDPAIGTMYFDDIKLQRIGVTSNKPTGQYAIFDVQASIGTPVRVAYDDPGLPGSEDYVWYSVVQEYDGTTGIILNKGNYDETESQAAVIPDCAWYYVGHGDSDFTVTPGDMDFTYDYANRLIKVETNEGNCEGYSYDGNGMRVQKRSSKDNTMTNYIYDQGGNVIFVENFEYMGNDCEPVGEISIGCGNHNLDPGEVCEDPGDYTTDVQCSAYPSPNPACPGQMWGTNLVKCAADCMGYDTSECYYSGDGIVSGSEECDDVGTPDVMCSDYDLGCNDADCVAATCNCDVMESLYYTNCDQDHIISCPDAGGNCKRYTSTGTEMIQDCECISGSCLGVTCRDNNTNQIACNAMDACHYWSACHYDCTRGDVFMCNGKKYETISCEYDSSPYPEICDYTYPSGSVHETGCCMKLKKDPKPKLVTAIEKPY
ncbi:MAG: hypothetical protein ABIE94_05280 [archaeon]